MKLEIVHATRYRYSGPIAETVMEVRLRPMDGNGQRCLEFDLELSSGIEARSYRDGYGNNVHYFNLIRPHTSLNVTSRSVVETGGDPDPDPDPGEELVHDFLRFRSPVKDVPGIRQLAVRHPIADPSSGSSVELALDELTLAISREFAYDRAVTNVYSSVDEVLALRAGVCQDFAHLFIAVARTMGVAARYVSGYIHAPGAATTASHAWAEAWVPGRGWVGYDATHPIRAAEHHVRLAVGRDYTDAAPTRGIYIGSATGGMEVTVRTKDLSASH